MMVMVVQNIMLCMEFEGLAQIRTVWEQPLHTMPASEACCMGLVWSLDGAWMDSVISCPRAPGSLEDLRRHPSPRKSRHVLILFL